MARLTCLEGSWGQLAADTDGMLWTYRQTPYARSPGVQGGASRSVVALSVPDLTVRFEADAGIIPLTVQDAPLIGSDQVVAVVWRDGQARLEAFDRRTFALRWSTAVPLVPRSGGCAYWPFRITEQVATAASGDSVVVASDGLTLIDARTGALQWRGQPGTTYFNPTIVDGQLYVIRDDSGPDPDPNTRNCSGNGFEVWEAAMSEPPSAPNERATATRTAQIVDTSTQVPTFSHTPTARPTCVPGCVP